MILTEIPLGMKAVISCRFNGSFADNSRMSLFFCARRFCAAAVLVCASAVCVFSLDLAISAADLRLRQGSDGGYHLYIRKKTDVNSVMLCETTKDPSMQTDTYAYRALEANNVNGSEKRVLDGKFIAPDKKNLYLMDSTFEYMPEFRSYVFHIYIPYIIVYGYPDQKPGQRYGEVYAGSGTFLNIRTFNLPYADYAGDFHDNPFVLQPVQRAPEMNAERSYMKDAEEAAERIAKKGGGSFIRSEGPKDISAQIRRGIEEELSGGGNADRFDIVIVLDTTNSMKNSIEQLKKELSKELQELFSIQENIRVGFMLFRDYRQQYLTKAVPFSSDLKKIQSTLNGVKVAGGGDLPEAIHEAIYDAAVKMDWHGSRRLMILITDAPPHLRPRGKITEADALKAASNRRIKISAILLPR
ncbi:MAG: VWA domain-containing protein [Spirochaetaceae bacterium]|jgi:hypothetical protein|nr:VWA domain-containing protein [Spirochaetaceae bacterium]